eukprot:TRINITY_DN5495_c0_g1_i1.p1 TRINITY_DN5495_c0_g1~~TRINITY_DN5495_c0_g1_i1.p1  ORF type:complete len:333 (-),score=55.95 TRINITY_DN5495_c0_g1_i1:86-1084(-)
MRRHNGFRNEFKTFFRNFVILFVVILTVNITYENVEWSTLFAPPIICIQDNEQITEELVIKDPKANSIAVVMVSISDKGDSIRYKKSVKKWREYCDLHGYKFVIQEKNTMDRSEVWMKIVTIQNLIVESLESGKIEWIFYADVDTIVMNPYIKISTFIPPRNSDVEFMIAGDGNGINAGVFMVKVSKWSLQFMEDVLRLDEDAYLVRAWQEQGAIEIIRQRRNKNQFIVVPQKWFNSYWNGKELSAFEHYSFQSGDFLVHFPNPNGKKHMMRYLNWVDHTRSCKSVRGEREIRENVELFWKTVCEERRVGSNTFLECFSPYSGWKGFGTRKT